MATAPQVSRRGQPLWALGGLLLCWVAMRAAMIELPAAPQFMPLEATPRPVAVAKGAQGPRVISHVRGGYSGGKAIEGAVRSSLQLSPHLPGPAPRPVASPLERPASVMPLTPPHLAQRAAGQNLLWMAAMGGLPLLPEVAAIVPWTKPAPPSAPLRARATGLQAGRWSGDAWIAWRPGQAALAAPELLTPVYGGSQAGAVLRYNLAEASPHRPVAYLRAVRSLGRQREGEVAAGLALRPLARLSVTAHAELRASPRGARPAAFVTGGVDSAPLGAGLVARGYAQGGYVGGRESTAFADGSAVAERRLWGGGDVDLTGGAGLWGGAQRGVGRVDLGPTASLRFRLGESAARLTADYRLRVAGNAEPAAGAALTLSAGF